MDYEFRYLLRASIITTSSERIHALGGFSFTERIHSLFRQFVFFFNLTIGYGS